MHVYYCLYMSWCKISCVTRNDKPYEQQQMFTFDPDAYAYSQHISATYITFLQQVQFEVVMIR